MKFYALALLPLMALVSKADITITFEGGFLYGTSVSNPIPDGSLVYAVATSSETFSGPTLGSFISGNDKLLGSWSVDSEVAGPGTFSALLSNISLTGGISTGQQIAIFWFPTLDLGSTGPVGGERYGFYTDPSWLVPADSQAVSFSIETVALGGAVPDSATIANLTVVPEPSAFAALAGFAALGFVALRRRR